jgi:heat shock protein HtpX
MTPSVSSFTTHARTWLLVAGLTALLLAIGAALGGGFLYIAVILALVMNVGGYWFSDRVALKMSRAQPLEPGQAPGLHQAVASLAQRAGVPTPSLYLIPSEQPNAFATGRNPQHAAIAVTEGLLRHLPADQVEGVIAHEMAHIKNRDILVSSIAATIAGAISGIATFLQFSWLFGGEDDESPLGLIGTIAAIIFAPMAAMLLQLAVSRQREYLADATAADLLGTPRPLMDALGTLERGTQLIPMAVQPAQASMYIANPLRGQGVASLFSTHPPMEERIARLAALDRGASPVYA